MATALNTIILDLGTTAIKAAVCNKNLKFEIFFSHPAAKITSNKGQYTSDAMAYLTIVEDLLKQCQPYCTSQPFLGLCYQRSSLLIWNSHSGFPVTPLISWQDTRGASSCKELQSYNSLIKQLTGLPLSAYYFAPKVRLLLQQQPALLQGLLNHDLRLGTLDSFLIWHWTAGKHYLTDVSMAARTLLMDIHTAQWSNTLSNIFNIPTRVLPEVCPSTGLDIDLINGMTLVTSVADQSAALLASIAKDNSEVLVNLGTGGFVIRHTSKHLNEKCKDYLNTLIYQDTHKNRYMAIEGTLNSITAALKPYPVENCTIESLAEINNIYCLAEPSGIGAPFFRADIGLTFSKSTDNLSKQQIANLILEGIIFRVALILEDFNPQAKISRIYLSGGLSTLPCLQQGIALCSPTPTYILNQKHSSLMGVAILANNLEPAACRQSTLISPTHKNPALIKKYHCWKAWFTQIIKA